MLPLLLCSIVHNSGTMTFQLVLGYILHQDDGNVRHGSSHKETALPANRSCVALQQLGIPPVPVRTSEGLVSA